VITHDRATAYEIASRARATREKTSAQIHAPLCHAHSLRSSAHRAPSSQRMHAIREHDEPARASQSNAIERNRTQSNAIGRIRTQSDAFERIRASRAARSARTRCSSARHANTHGLKAINKGKIMANISIRKNDGNTIARPPTQADWEPLRVMRSLLNWDPFREMAAFPMPDERGAVFAPTFEVKETKDSYLFKADVPGIKESDLEVTVTGNRLTVSGKRDAEKEEQTDTYYAYERSYGQFTRSFTLPDGADMEKLNADLKDGVLTLSLPKKPEVQPKKIAVKAGTPTPSAKA
jgi:HSP20 family protein